MRRRIGRSALRVHLVEAQLDLRAPGKRTQELELVVEERPVEFEGFCGRQGRHEPGLDPPEQRPLGEQHEPAHSRILAGV